MAFITRARVLLAQISRWVALAGLYLLLIMAILVSVDVLLRKVFGIAFVGTDEFAGYALAIATSWALAFALFEGSHIRVNAIYINLSERAQAFLNLLAIVFVGVLIGLLGTGVWALADESWTFNAVSNTPLRLPLWIPQYLFFGGIALFFISAMVMFVESIGLLLRGNHHEVNKLVDRNSSEDAIL